MSDQNEHVLYANEVLSGLRKPSPSEAWHVARQLRDISLERMLLDAIGDDVPDRQLFLRIKQRLAYCTYKDLDLPAPRRFELALDILKRFCDLENTTDPETLGLAGAIYKRLWELTHHRRHLDRSLALFRRAHDLDPADDAWVSLSTAFALDLLAVEERSSGLASAAEHVAQADEIRRTALLQLEAQDEPRWSSWWFYSSLAEAALGLGDIARAEAALSRGLSAAPRSDELETVARTLAAVTRMRFDETSASHHEARGMLMRVFGISDFAVEALMIGRIGLALSGGGFRASLFHIGVLAKLAELDLLRHVDVISCVSGGSILGTYYYLELKKRLERGPVSSSDYIEIVRDVERKFLAGVQQNLRTRIAANPFRSVAMALRFGYNRSHRVGELYQKRLFDVAYEGDEPAPRVMSELMMRLPGMPNFNPAHDNWKQDAKVPILILNATSLNTGHNWQFTASWMGESPQTINPAVDAISRMRRQYYADSREVPIGLAVAASACVPGLFEPIELGSGDRAVRLVDGGVHDNQGLTGLLEYGCQVILVSDASGQLAADDDPDAALAGTVARANDILQARVREARYEQLETLRTAGVIQGSMFVHLTQDLQDGGDAPSAPQASMTSYGIDCEIQTRLARVRTDLDSFSDAEAFALMTSGYMLAGHALVQQHSAPTLPIRTNPIPWGFLSARPALAMTDPAANERMKRVLRESHRRFFKIWHLMPPLQILGYALVAVIAVPIVLTFVRDADQPLFGIDSIPVPMNAWMFVVLVALAAAIVFHDFMHDRLRLRKRVGEFFLGFGLLLATPIVWLHLYVFDRIFLWYGRWQKAPE